MLLCFLVIGIVSVCLMLTPLRQIGAYLAREDQRPKGAPPRWMWRLRAFGVMVRNEDHPQHRPALQVAMLLLAVVVLGVSLLRLFAPSR